MRILIIEENRTTATMLMRIAHGYFADKLLAVAICNTLKEGLDYIENNKIDILLIDMDVNGKSDFKKLGLFARQSFHIIIISEFTDNAIIAFAYGVSDFVPKPIDPNRLSQAFTRVKINKEENHFQHLAIKENSRISLIDVKDVLYIKGAGIYSELHLKNGLRKLHDKSLDTLLQLLPNSFRRIHKSYLICMHQADKIIVQPGSRYCLMLRSGQTIPIGRSKYKEIRSQMI